MDAFKLRQTNGVNGEANGGKADGLESAILRALGEADELLEARGVRCRCIDNCSVLQCGAACWSMHIHT